MIFTLIAENWIKKRPRTNEQYNMYFRSSDRDLDMITLSRSLAQRNMSKSRRTRRKRRKPTYRKHRKVNIIAPRLLLSRYPYQSNYLSEKPHRCSLVRLVLFLFTIFFFRWQVEESEKDENGVGDGGEKNDKNFTK